MFAETLRIHHVQTSLVKNVTLRAKQIRTTIRDESMTKIFGVVFSKITDLWFFKKNTILLTSDIRFIRNSD